MKIVLILVLVLALLPIQAFSAKSDEFLTHASDIIFKDCQGKNISVLYLADSNNSPIDHFSWPYNQSYVKQILSLYAGIEPFAECHASESGSVCIGAERRGLRILTCGENHLDISGYDYRWNDELIQLPTMQINSFSGINTGNFAQGISNSQIQQTQNSSEITVCEANRANLERDNFWLSTWYPVIMSFFAASLSSWLEWKKRKEFDLGKVLITLFVFILVSYLAAMVLKAVV